MSTLDLRGFAIPGPTRPTFVVPYFGSPTSNAIFVQELDDQHRVAEFLSFDPTHFNDYMGPFLVAQRRIGEEGLVGFIDREGKLVAGTVSEIRRVLADYSFAPDGSDAFFATEVMEFRGDRAGLERAIDFAAHRFANPERGMQWKAREITSRWSLESIASARENERLDTLRELRDALREPKWVAQFVAAWDLFGPDSDLGDLALDWLSAGGAERAEAGHLFNTLLTPSKFSRAHDRSSVVAPGYVIEMGRRWIERMAFPYSGWVSLWHKLRRRNYVSPDLLNDLGLRFLHIEPDYRTRKPRPLSANAWMRVWRTLWMEGVERDLLVDLLHKHPELLALGEFQNIVELLSAEPGYQDLAREFYGTWLEKSPRHLPRWPKACLELIKRYEERGHLLDLAMEWLSKAGAGFHSWYNLWSGLRPFVEHDRLVRIGRDWLIEGRITMRIWPEVLADLIEMENLHSDESLRPIAQQWLQLGKKNSRREVIEAFANRPQAYGKRHSREQRLFLSYHFEADYWRVAQIRNRLLVDEDMRVQAVLESATWDELKKDGHSAVETFIENQLRAASVALILFGTETATREWVRYEVMRSHQLGLGVIAIDIHRIRDRNGQIAKPGPNPLSLWQVEIDGEQRAFSEIYPTYDWVEDDGSNNIARWIAEAAPHNHPLVTSAKLRD